MPIHVAITRKVKPGCERAFEESLRELFKDSLAREGVLGVHLISPPQGSNTRDYGVLRTFTNEGERDEFYGSERYGQWQQQVAALTEADHRELHGLEAWFPSAGSPPRWKMALLTWLAALADQCAGGDFIRPGFRESSGSRKFGDYRRGNRVLSYLDPHAGVSAARSLMAALTRSHGAPQTTGDRR